MRDNEMTIYGNVGTPVDYRDNKGFVRAMFRVGSTPRFFDRQQGGWRDLETVWVSVKVTRHLAHNAAASLKVGDPVVVIGRMRTHVWEDKETQEPRKRDVLEAYAVCHDLNWGTTVYTRSEPVAVADPVESETETVRDFEENVSAPLSA